VRRTDDQRLRDIVESIDAVDRADALLRAHPVDAEVETDYLLGDPANAQHLRDSIERLESDAEPKPDLPS
jgi:hypothetical protein